MTPVTAEPNSKHAGTVQRRDEPRWHRAVWREYAESLIVAVVLALVIRAFVLQAFVIPSGSMLPTLRIGDYVLVNKFEYVFRPIRRGDVIVFKFPQDETRDFIKRVIGLPGDSLEIRGSEVLVNGKPLREPYAFYAEPPLPGLVDGYHLGPFVIPRGQLFMMGDNRENSLDSRAWGLLDEAKVVGKASLVYFSIRSADVPASALLPKVFYAFLHPSLLRWSRIGHLVQ